MTLLLWLLALSFPPASAASPGHFSGNGVNVWIRLAGSTGGYTVAIESQSGHFTCSFPKTRFLEVEEGDLRYEEDGCRIRVLQRDDNVLSVRTSDGCQYWCGAGATMQVGQARRVR